MLKYSSSCLLALVLLLSACNDATRDQAPAEDRSSGMDDSASTAPDPSAEKVAADTATDVAKTATDNAEATEAAEPTVGSAPPAAPSTTPVPPVTGSAPNINAKATGGMPTALIWCRTVGKRTTAETCTGYQEEIADLTKGVAAFDPPRQMVKNEIRIVRLGVARDDGSTPPRATEIVGGDADTAVRAVEIGAKMRAQLSGGAAFTIDPAEPQDKFMGRAKEQVWTWNVTPKLQGKHSLSATITVLAEDGTVLDNYESKAIEVEVAVSEAEALQAKRDRTRGTIKWYEELGKLLTDLWYVWLGLALAVIYGIWRMVRAARTGEDPNAGSDTAGKEDKADEDKKS